MTVEFTTNEALLSELIEMINPSNSEFSAQRDKDILYALQMVLTISSDGKLSDLIWVMSEKFPEYGNPRI